MIDLTKVEGKITEIPLKEISIDGGTQMRDHIDERTVAEYADAISDGHDLPPAVVFFDGRTNWLADGFHRYHGTAKAGLGSMLCEQRKGTRRDAILYAAGANADHGLKRSNADKRRSVEALLADEEWAAKSDRWIAETCRVHHSFVGKIRGEPSSTGDIASSPVRVGQDGKARQLPRKTHETNGKAPAPTPTPDTTTDPQPWPGDGSEEPTDIEFRTDRDFYEGTPDDAEPITDSDWQPGESDLALKDREAIKRRDDAIVKGFGTLVRLVDEQADALTERGHGSYLRTVDDLNDTLRTYRTWRGLAT